MELTDKELFDLIAAHGPWKTPMDAYRAFHRLGFAAGKAEGLKRAGEICRDVYRPGDWNTGAMVAEKCAAAIEAAKDV